VKISGVAEQTAPKAPIKAQSAAVARATASICNAEWGLWGGMSGHGGNFHRLSAQGARILDRLLRRLGGLVLGLVVPVLVR
jgi:hypothetical protein